ncbi:MAG: potassium channel family protein [Candidatus Eremiobacteraeota bacterium]|nr:potassium channel family protein [Candidatus Eremiobacteraeota bacterium]
MDNHNGTGPERDGSPVAQGREGPEQAKGRKGAPPLATPRGFWSSYTAMLVSIVMLIIVSPLIDRNFIGLIILDLLFGSIVFMGFAIVLKEKRRLLTGATIIAIALIMDLSNLNGTTSTKIVITSSVELIFLGYISSVILANVLNAKRVTGNEISGAICVYFLMGIMWALIYYMIEFTWPGSYSSLPSRSVNDAITFRVAMDIFSSLLYFSFITLTSVGYGDCAPLTIMSRGFSTLEAVIGQFFIALIVARLVGLFLLNRQQSLREACEETPAGESATAEEAASESAAAAPPAVTRGKENKGSFHLSPTDFFKSSSSWLFVSLLIYLVFCPLLVKETKMPFLFIHVIFFAIIISGLRLMRKSWAMMTCLIVLIGTFLIIDYHIVTGEVLGLFLPGALIRLLIIILIMGGALATLRHREEVTYDHIISGASVYILLGILWSEIYFMIELSSHGSFLFNGVPWHNYGTIVLMERLKMTLLFFSYTTLTTVGYGDTVPFTHVARLWTYLEAVTGVIYLVVLLGYLVSARVSQAYEKSYKRR